MLGSIFILGLVFILALVVGFFARAIRGEADMREVIGGFAVMAVWGTMLAFWIFT